MGTNTFCAPGHSTTPAPGDAAAGAGCLGMAGGSSTDPAVMVKGKGKGKGKGSFPKKPKKVNLNCSIHAHAWLSVINASSQFCPCGLSILRDLMPTDDAKAASVWATAKLIKSMGEAKMIVIRLSSVKHQEKLRAFSQLYMRTNDSSSRCCFLPALYLQFLSPGSTIGTHAQEMESIFTQLQNLATQD